MKTNPTQCFTKKNEFGFALFSGLEGNRTPVRKSIPDSSTSVVCCLTFPLPPENKHPGGVSSFMIRPLEQSLSSVVSHIVEAWVLRCECPRSDYCQIRQRMLNYLQRLNLILPFNALPATRFFRFKIPVETFTSPYECRKPTLFISKGITLQT